ncbi:MAG TPA: PilZ domain-containing protein [Phycisphaerae bacterium]|nr:PilZ domain-containing protein [Phycisphaerae bacterium]HOJ76096.1 PilZ domain-containing protein [Phycisphaerae bacterium]HOM51862.1 PilZ domain-containing protein [Phycisphaerae bacterium]HOQ87520.1 PilZ domain-containing protein [Phycisphaerae bacterium]HPP28607.1 PilZ domain-containing protein [Phycisphaerae bacterium]
MPQAGAHAFVVIPTESPNARRMEATVLAAVNERVLLRLAYPIRPETGTSVQIEYFRGRKFLQAEGIVQGYAASRPSDLLRVKLCSPPRSAEKRESYRAVILAAQLPVELGDGTVGTLADVSATGLSVITSAEYLPGEVVELRLEYGDHRLHGRARVRNHRLCRHGLHQYGLAPLPSEHALLDGLGRLSTAVQLHHIRRLRASIRAG